MRYATASATSFLHRTMWFPFHPAVDWHHQLVEDEVCVESRNLSSGQLAVIGVRRVRMSENRLNPGEILGPRAVSRFWIQIRVI